MHSMGGIIKRIWKSLSQISCDDDVVKIIILIVAERLKQDMMKKIIAIPVTNMNIYASFNVSR